jgi:hypothetical protein
MWIIVLIKIKVLELRLKDVNLQILRHNWSKLLYGQAVLSDPLLSGLPLPLCGIAITLYTSGAAVSSFASSHHDPYLPWYVLRQSFL